MSCVSIIRGATVRANPHSCSTGPRERSSVTSLQESVCQFPAEHYSREGTRPLLYATALLITLQYKKLLLFLHVERMASALRDVAAVLSIALFAMGLLQLPAPEIDEERGEAAEADRREQPTAAVAAAAQVLALSWT